MQKYTILTIFLNPVITRLWCHQSKDSGSRHCSHCCHIVVQTVYMLQELDAEASFSADWTVTSMSDNVLKHADEMPEDLKSVVEEDVRLIRDWKPDFPEHQVLGKPGSFATPIIWVWGTFKPGFWGCVFVYYSNVLMHVVHFMCHRIHQNAILRSRKFKTFWKEHYSICRPFSSGKATPIHTPHHTALGAFDISVRIEFLSPRPTESLICPLVIPGLTPIPRFDVF